MRIEKDSMGEMEVADSALYGASTQRAVLNFKVSNLRFDSDFIKSLGIIKYSAATANEKLGMLQANIAKHIKDSANEVISGKYNDQFVVDIFQTGSGTSTNMNANEVIANLAIQKNKGSVGDKSIHPNDHVNMGQSSNDVIPTAIHISSADAVLNNLIPALSNLQNCLAAKSLEFKDVIKSGRTHLQDATPITLGQEFSAFESQVEKGIGRLKSTLPNLLELALGGTAVGTGLNTHPDFAKLAIKEISTLTGIEFTEASNHFEAQASRDAIVELSGQLKTIACSLIKIANDIRWLAAGPRCSIAELNLPEIQPGSSIMPAKVNPVICESVMMVCAQVIGNDQTITVAGQHGNFQLNVMLPVIAHNILESINLLANVSNNFVDKCLNEITANAEKCLEYADSSLATCTSLAPIIGYDLAAKVAKHAYTNGTTVRVAAAELNVLETKELEKALNLLAMTTNRL